MKSTIEALDLEIKELKRQLAIRDELSCQACKGVGTALIAIDDGMDCPECEDRDNKIRADAVMDSITNCKVTPMYGSDIMGTVYVADLIEYSIKLEGKQ